MRIKPKLGLVIGLLVALGAGCGGDRKKKPAPRDPQPPRPVPGRTDPVKEIIDNVGHTSTHKEREKAVGALVRGWPATRPALPAVLKLLQWDKENRGGYAMSIARIGKPLVAPLNQMLAKAPRHRPTLLAAGVVAYHLVLRDGLTRRSDAEFAAIRNALQPSFGHFWRAFLAETRHEEEIYLGLAACAEEALKRFRPPFAKGGLSRVAYVLYLVLGSGQNQKLLPAADRLRLRARSGALAAPFTRALIQARPDGTGESPDHLMLGLAVLGRAAAAALAQEPGLAKLARCGLVVKALGSVLEQSPASALMPARAHLARCASRAPDAPVKAQANALLGKLPSKALSKAKVTR